MRSCAAAAVGVLPATGLFLGLALCTPGALSHDVDLLQVRLAEEHLCSIDTADVAASLSAQQLDGSFADVDYGSRAMAAWPPVMHLERLKEMAAAYRELGGAFEGDTAVIVAIEGGLSFWYSVAPESDNWWFNEIGKQRELGPIGIS